MTNIDQFESVFKSADKTPFTHEAVDIHSVLVVTDADDKASQSFAQQARTFLKVLEAESPLQLSTLTGQQYTGVGQLLQQVGRHEPDLICTYRNLSIPASEYPYSLGVYVDVLTQASTIPVLLLPHPSVELDRPDVLAGTGTVMAITDHLTGDHHLVSYAVHMAEPQGKLFLSHVEDAADFERYITTISKIPTIDTESAREEILEQLLKEPHDYIRSCRDVLKSEGLPIDIEETLTLGHHLSDYKRLIEEHEVNLLVLNTKDDEQLAMHGLAYPLSIELRQTPLLLL